MASIPDVPDFPDEIFAVSSSRPDPIGPPPPFKSLKAADADEFDSQAAPFSKLDELAKIMSSSIDSDDEDDKKVSVPTICVSLSPCIALRSMCT